MDATTPGIGSSDLTEFGGRETAHKAGCGEGDLVIDEQAEPIGMGYRGALLIVLQFDEGIGDGGEAEGAINGILIAVALALAPFVWRLYASGLAPFRSTA